MEGGGEEGDGEEEYESHSGEEGDAATVFVWCCGWRWHLQLEKMDVGGVDVIQGFWTGVGNLWRRQVFEVDVCFCFRSINIDLIWAHLSVWDIGSRRRPLYAANCRSDQSAA